MPVFVARSANRSAAPSEPPIGLILKPAPVKSRRAMALRIETSSGSIGSRSATVINASCSTSPGPRRLQACRRELPVARPRRRHVGAMPSARRSSEQRVGMPGHREPDDRRPLDRRRNPRAVAERSEDQRMRRARLDRRDDPGGQCQPRPGVAVPPAAGLSERRTPGVAASRIDPTWLGERVPPAAIARLTQETRHDERRTSVGGRPRAHPQRPSGSHRARSPAFGASSKVMGNGAWPYRAASSLPSVAPRRRRDVRHGSMRAGQPDQAPGARHHPIRVVAAATRRQPAAAGVPVRHRVHQARRLAHRGRRHPQVRQRVPGVRIGSRAATRSGPARTRRPARGGAPARPPATRPRRCPAPAAR